MNTAAGASSTALRRRWNAIHWMNFGFAGWTALVFLFLYLPIALLVVYSFNDSRWNVEWQGFTMKWYGALFERRSLLVAFQNSLLVACVTAVLATVLGTLGAWVLHRYRFPFAHGIGLLVFVPMVMPEVLMGAGFLLLFVMLEVPRGFGTLIVAHTTFCFPFVMVAARARLSGIDPNLEEAALDLGATPSQAFFKVILPFLMPAVVTGALMSFTLSLDEYIVTLFTAGADQTLPLHVFGMVKTGLDPRLNALSAIFLFFTFALLLFAIVVRKLTAR